MTGDKIDLEKFEREELPRIKSYENTPTKILTRDFSMLIQAFEAAMAELREERKRSEESFKVLDLIVAEFKSDPMSVACFDLRVVNRAKKVVAHAEEIRRGK